MEADINFFLNIYWISQAKIQICVCHYMRIQTMLAQYQKNVNLVIFSDILNQK